MKTGRVVDEVAGEEPGWSSKTGKIEKPDGAMQRQPLRRATEAGRGQP